MIARHGGRADLLAEDEDLTVPCAALARRLPLEALRRHYLGSGARLLPNNCELARLLDVHVRQVQRWVNEGGLTERYADRIACRIGVHPSAIWHDWWEGADDRYSITEAGRRLLAEIDEVAG